jgi:hypothetical protein
MSTNETKEKQPSQKVELRRVESKDPRQKKMDEIQEKLKLIRDCEGKDTTASGWI